ncbi:hypothetical protein, partial [Pseudomonas syringae group genomosp. 7]
MTADDQLQRMSNLRNQLHPKNEDAAIDYQNNNHNPKHQDTTHNDLPAPRSPDLKNKKHKTITKNPTLNKNKNTNNTKNTKNKKQQQTKKHNQPQKQPTPQTHQTPTKQPTNTKKKS